MNKKILSVLLIFVFSLLLWGCSSGPIENKNDGMGAPLLAGGPAAQLAKIDKDVMLPALGFYENIAKYDQAHLQEYRQSITVGMESINREEIVRLNDAYLYFGKKYLYALDEFLNLVLQKQYDKAEQFKKVNLEDARLAFVNARNVVINKESSYKLNIIDSQQITKGMSYYDLRGMLNMPGEHLESFAVIDYKNKISKNIEPVLWEYNGQYLYVEFVDGKSTKWKLQRGTDFGKRADKRFRKQIEAWDKEVVQPIWQKYTEYRKNKGDLAKQKVYNEAAAIKQKEEIEKLLLLLKNSEGKLNNDALDIEGSQTYFVQSKQLIKQIEKRMQYAQILSTDTKDKKLVRDNINKGNALENWDIWRTYFYYCNALKVLTEGKSNYQFPNWAFQQFPKKPWVGSLMHWFRMPGEHLHRHMVQDENDPKKWYRHDIYLWVKEDGFVYGYFVNDRLTKGKMRSTNDGFYHEK